MSQLILLLSEYSVSALSQTLCYSLFQISCLDTGNNFGWFWASFCWPRVSSLDYDFLLTFVQQLNNIDFSVLLKGEMLGILNNYLMNVYQSCIIQSTLENGTNIKDLFLSFFYRSICELW